MTNQHLGISAIVCHEPPLVLDNSWFRERGIIGKKFEEHTGTRSRRVSTSPESEMGVQVCYQLQERAGIDFRACAVFILVSTTHIPAGSEQYLLDSGISSEYIYLAEPVAQEIASRVGITTRAMYVINWGCSGYVRAIEIAGEEGMQDGQYMLIVTTNQSSRVVDYYDPVTGALFGDYATATVLSSVRDAKYPVCFRIMCASTKIYPLARQVFSLEVKERVRVPASEGGERCEESRLCMRMDGDAVGEKAPVIMCEQVESVWSGQYRTVNIVPHQAGVKIGEWLEMRLDSAGIHAPVTNGVTTYVGNIAAASLPYVLSRLPHGSVSSVICPTAGIDFVGRPQMTGGVLTLQTCR